MNEIAMMKARRAAVNVLKYALLIFAAFVALVPIVSCVVTAFKTPEEYATRIRFTAAWPPALSRADYPYQSYFLPTGVPPHLRAGFPKT